MFPQTKLFAKDFFLGISVLSFSPNFLKSFTFFPQISAFPPSPPQKMLSTSSQACCLGIHLKKYQFFD